MPSITDVRMDTLPHSIYGDYRGELVNMTKPAALEFCKVFLWSDQASFLTLTTTVNVSASLNCSSTEWYSSLCLMPQPNSKIGLRQALFRSHTITTNHQFWAPRKSGGGDRRGNVQLWAIVGSSKAPWPWPWTLDWVKVTSIYTVRVVRGLQCNQAQDDTRKQLN